MSFRRRKSIKCRKCARVLKLESQNALRRSYDVGKSGYSNDVGESWVIRELGNHPGVGGRDSPGRRTHPNVQRVNSVGTAHSQLRSSVRLSFLSWPPLLDFAPVYLSKQQGVSL